MYNFKDGRDQAITRKKQTKRSDDRKLKYSRLIKNVARASTKHRCAVDSKVGV